MGLNKEEIAQVKDGTLHKPQQGQTAKRTLQAQRDLVIVQNSSEDGTKARKKTHVPNGPSGSVHKQYRRWGIGEETGGIAGAVSGDEVVSVPESIEQCKKSLQKVNVCIMDLIKTRRIGTTVHAFRTLAELQGHIKNTTHCFPRDKAKKQV